MSDNNYYNPYASGQDNRQPSQEPIPVSAFFSSYPTVPDAGVYHPYPQDPIAPQTPPAPKKRRGTKMAVVALCLCFTMIGGIAGGAVGAHLFTPPAAVTQSVDAAGTPETTPHYQPVAYMGAQLTLSQLYEKCNPAVVAISTEVSVRNAFGQYATQATAGSGFVISEDGYIVTNNHVIDGASTIRVILYDGVTYDATLVGRDAAADLAVLKIKPDSKLTALEWGDSGTLKVGDSVAAIGNPLGELANSLTSGVISALDREINIDGTPMHMMQTDAAISPGNSGGPLINMYGQVVGVNTAKSSGDGVEGLGFSIPINEARDVIEQLIQYGYVQGRPQLGISIEDVTAAISRYTGLSEGVYVVSVTAGSAADKAGIQAGDVIVAVGEVKITSSAELLTEKLKYKAGETVPFTVMRSNQSHTLSVTFDEVLPEIAAAPTPTPDNPWRNGNSGGDKNAA